RSPRARASHRAADRISMGRARRAWTRIVRGNPRDAPVPDGACMSRGVHPQHARAASLVDVLDRVLDKGLVVAGDVKVSIAEVELLTIRIRLIVCSIDKAEQIGLDWWKFDHHLSPGKQALSAENEELKKEIRLLERKLASLSRRRSAAGR